MKGLAPLVMTVRGRLTMAVTILFAAVVLSGSWFLLNRAEAAWVGDLRAQDTAELEALADQLQTIDTSVIESTGAVLPLPVGVNGTTFMLIDEAGAVFGATPVEVFTSGVVGSIQPDGESGVIVDSALGVVESRVIRNVVTASVAVPGQDRALTLVASSSLAPVQAGLDALSNTLWVVSPLLIVAVAILAWFVTGRAFRPVAAITNQVEKINDDRLDERIPVPNSRDEVAHLARTMNTMLDRLATGRRRQREFVSDASHELRNPVATSKAELEVGLAHVKETDWEETARTVLEEQDRLAQLVEDLLLLARIDESPQARSRQDVDLDDVIFTEASRPQVKSIDIAGVEAVQIKGDQGQLVRLVRNLLDNATRYAATQVIATLRAEHSQAVLVIEDDGPGIPENERERVLERFVRRDDARTRAEGGAGLGLAIVQAVATAHKGTVTITEGASGGARFEVRLPMTQGDGHETNSA